MSHQNRWLLGHLLSSTAIVGASALGLTLAASANKAFAACDIANPTEGQTVTCSGADATGVYAADGERNITVNLEAGASITPPAATTPIDLNGSSSVNLGEGSSVLGDNTHGIAFTDSDLYSNGLSTITLNGADVSSNDFVGIEVDLTAKSGGMLAMNGYSFTGDSFSLSSTGSDVYGLYHGALIQAGVKVG